LSGRVCPFETVEQLPPLVGQTWTSAGIHFIDQFSNVTKVTSTVGGGGGGGEDVVSRVTEAEYWLFGLGV
jgi:hypothetical protein